MGHHDFKASNGWFNNLLIVENQQTSKRKQWKVGMNKRKVLMTGYKVWNTDETGCFYKTLAERKECKGGKKVKERLTIAFCHQCY